MSKSGKSGKSDNLASVNYYSTIDSKEEKAKKLGKKKTKKRTAEQDARFWALVLEEEKKRRLTHQVGVDFRFACEQEEKSKRKQMAEDYLIANGFKLQPTDKDKSRVDVKAKAKVVKSAVAVEQAEPAWVTEHKAIMNNIKIKRIVKRLAAEEFLTACVSTRGFRQSAHNFQPCLTEDFVTVATYLLTADSDDSDDSNQLERWKCVERHLYSLCDIQADTGISQCLVADHRAFLSAEIDASLLTGVKTDALTKYLTGALEIADKDSAIYLNARFILIVDTYLNCDKFRIDDKSRFKFRTVIDSLLRKCDSIPTVTTEVTDNGFKCELAILSIQSIIEIFRGRAHQTASLLETIRTHFWHQASNDDDKVGTGYFCSSVSFRNGKMIEKPLHFDIDANTAAIQCGAATPEQQEQIFTYARHHVFSPVRLNTSVTVKGQAKMLFEMSRADPNTLSTAHKWHAFAQDHLYEWCGITLADSEDEFETVAVAALFCAIDDQLQANDRLAKLPT